MSVVPSRVRNPTPLSIRIYSITYRLIPTPEVWRSYVASSADHPQFTIEKRVAKKSGEKYWIEIPSNLWAYVDASTIIVSGDSGGWDESICNGIDPYAQWGWVSHSTGDNGHACDFMFRPTLGSESFNGGTGYHDAQDGGDDPMHGNYRLVNNGSCQTLGFYGNVESSNYAPKPMLNFVVADNRWSKYPRGTLGAPSCSNNCMDFVMGGPQLTSSGTASGMLYSGNVWDFPGQLMGDPGFDVKDGYADHNTLYANMGGWMNDICIPLSGLPHHHVGGGRRSLGDCPDLSAGIPWTGAAIDNFDISAGDAPCGPPWCL